MSSAPISRAALTDLICARLTSSLAELRAAFDASGQAVGVRHVVVDDLLPVEIAERIHRAFPQPSAMRLMDSFRERKYTSKRFDQFDPLMADITFAVQDPRVVAIVEQITGIREQIPDSSLYAGGLSAMVKGHHLGPHIDNSHEASRRYYRTLNLLYYVTPGWTLENGGNLELWDRRVQKNVTLVSRFNRLALMETTPTSWHSVSPVVADGTRCCVSNYYFSPRSPTGTDYFNVTSFSARPEQPLLRLLARADNGLRQGLRALVPQGLGKKDVYEGPKP
ncbi:MAG: 2OG-Fe(II) oxygenase [Burkholderiales bacterium]|nr:MAG: 2OG-Fe(II) oxygenase [Burkholderiales bacterium]